MQMLQRVTALAGRLRGVHGGGENILIVAHGASLCALVVALLGLPAAAIWRFRLTNGGVSKITVFNDGAAALDLFNDTGHLQSCPPS